MAAASSTQDAELRRLRSRLADAESELEVGRQASREGRAVDEARMWLAELPVEPGHDTDHGVDVPVWMMITVFRAGGRTLLALVSDDNENMLQRTLLLVFAVLDE